MIQLKISLLFLFALFSCIQASGQIDKSEKELSKYIKTFQLSKVDTIIIVRLGCAGCELTYDDTSESINDGQTIYVLTQDNGLLKVAVFDDLHNPRYFGLDTCSFFNYLDNNKSLLKAKDQFYKKELAELKKSKFFPPGPIHYSFTDLTVQMKSFKYNFIVVDDNLDYLGFVREHEKWFQATKSIIEQFFNCVKEYKN